MRLNQILSADWFPGKGLTQKELSQKELSLARFEAALGLVNDQKTALTANNAAVAMTRLQGLQAIANFHGSSS